MNFTDQGIRTYPDTLRRAEAGAQLMQQLGGSLKEAYWTMGSHDLVAIFEAPDAETITAALLATGAQGNLRTQTLRAFSREEMEGILNIIPQEGAG